MVRIRLVPWCLLLAGCTVGPDYRAPDLAVPAGWNTAPPQAAAAPSADLAHWWTRFDDPQLTSLVDRAFRSNLDLRIAAARVREARGLRGVVAADRAPSVDATAQGAGSVGDAPRFSNFLVALDALWEIDVFGGVRRSVEAADAEIGAAEEERRAAALGLAGAVAAAYIELRGLQQRIIAVRANLAAQQETRELTEAQRRVGLASDLDVERGRAQVATTAAELPPLESAVDEGIHRLGVLLGEPPASLFGELAAAAPIPSAPPELVVGVPADLLRRRPDLRRAERELAAATARIGEAKADLYPRFTLTGSIGLRSEDLKDLVKGKGGFAAVGPNITWPVFAGGRILANVDVQSAREEQALARYERTLYDALEEVESSLVRHAREQVRRRDLKEATEANREAVELARRLHAAGLANFLDVLVAQRALLESESRLVESETAVSASLVAVYVGLGGGWDAVEEVSLR